VTAAPLVASDPRPPAVRLGMLWFGLLGGPVAWAAQLLVDYPFAAHFCFPDAAPRIVPTIDSLRFIIALVSLLAIIVGVLALVTAMRSWRIAGGRFGDERAELTESAPPAGRVRFMALGGILVSSLTLLGILLHSGFILLLAPCV
jgi:hypothetical protein